MIPERVDSRIGTLTFEDGFPTEETANKIYDQLDFQRAVESVMNNELPDLYNIEMDPREQINITTDNA